MFARTRTRKARTMRVSRALKRPEHTSRMIVFGNALCKMYCIHTHIRYDCGIGRVVCRAARADLCVCCVRVCVCVIACDARHPVVYQSFSSHSLAHSLNWLNKTRGEDACATVCGSIFVRNYFGSGGVCAACDS